jgi:hypothetical protein
MPRTGGIGEPLIYAEGMAVAGALAQLALSFVLHPSRGMGHVMGAMFIAFGTTALLLVIMPFAMLVGGAIMHVIWSALGSKQEFEVSLRCVAFSAVLFPVQAVLSNVPVAGPFLGALVTLYSAYYFLPSSIETHGLPPGRVKAVFAVGFSILVLFAGCSAMMAWKMSKLAKVGSPEQAALVGAFTRQMSQLPKAGSPQEQAVQAPPATPADMEKLKSALPKQLPGFTGPSVEATVQGGGNGAPGMSVARGSFDGANGARIQVEIVDAGGLGMMLQGIAMIPPFDRTGANGFERTIEYKGGRGIDKYDAAQRDGSTQLVVGGHFLVRVVGQRVDAAAIRSALDAVDLAVLSR